MRKFRGGEKKGGKRGSELGEAAAGKKKETGVSEKGTIKAAEL